MSTNEHTDKIRADYQPANELSERLVLAKKPSHALKIGRYKLQLMGLLGKRVSQTCYVAIDALTAEMADSMPENSEIALYSDLIGYVSFCIEQHFTYFLPFCDDAIDAYLSHTLAGNVAKATITRRLSSLTKWADLLGWDDPRKSRRIKLRLGKIRQALNSSQNQAQGLSANDLNKALDVFNAAIPRDAQDITLLFVGWETLCRRSELVSFDWPDFTLNSDGSGALRLKRSKTDKEGQGAQLYISPYTANMLIGWRHVSNRRNKNSPIFRGIYSDGYAGDRLSHNGVNRSFKRIATRLGLDAHRISGHSTRVGSAQEMIERNIDSAKIMLSGRWKSMAMLIRYAERINIMRSGMADLAKMLDSERPKPWIGSSHLLASTRLSISETERMDEQD